MPGLDVIFFDFIGIFLRWIFEYRCTLNKKKLKELTKDEKGRNLWYSIAFYAVLIIWAYIVLKDK
ncbi:MAG: hypothetical protein WDA08_12195 [Weeksellaceae bacterium]|nr:hypothetical protein [Acholeplasmataceae bacterium]